MLSIESEDILEVPSGSLEHGLEDFFTPYQRKWIADDSPLKLCQKSRRIGMTYASSFRVSIRAMEGKCDTWVSTRDTGTAKEFILYCDMWVRCAGAVASLGTTTVDYQDHAGELAEVNAFVVTFSNGSRIYSLSSNPNALAGKGGHIVLDEFALHQDQSLLWKIAQPTASVWGYQIEVISTQRGKATKFNQFVEGAQGENRMGWSLHTITIYDAVEQELVDKINASVVSRGGAAITAEDFIAKQRASCDTEADWLQEYCCQPQDSLGALLSYELIDSAQRSWEYLYARDYSIARHAAGWDIARKKDISSVSVVAELQNLYYIRHLEEVSGKLTNQALRYNTIFRQFRCNSGAIDATGIGLSPSETVQEDLGPERVEALHFSQSNKADMASRMLSLFQDQRILIPNEYLLREDLHSIEKGVSKNGKFTYDAASTDLGHGDRFWSISLAVRALANTSLGPVEGLSLRSRLDDHGREVREPNTDFGLAASRGGFFS